MKKYYNGKYDVVFKAVFCDENEPELLKIFLEKILNIQIEELHFLNQELQPNDVEERKKIVDLLVKVDNEYIHVELNQIHSEYLHVRNFCYFTNIYSKHTRRGEEYDLVNEYIHIDISYGLRDKQEKREYYVMDEMGNKYVKNIKIIEFNMDRIMDFWYNNDNEKIKEYKYLIMLDLDRNSLNVLSEGDSFMEDYKKKIDRLNESDRYTSWITPEEDERLILNTEKRISYNEGKEEGIQEGIEEGKRKSQIEIAKAFIQNKVELGIISKSTGLSIEDLKDLVKELEQS